MSGELLEREAELGQIQDAIETALAGTGSLMIVEAEPGLGKTRLLEEAARLARQAGMRQLHARGTTLEDQFAFGVVRQLFEGALADASAQEREQLLGGAAALAGSLLGYGTPVEDHRPAGDASFAALHGLYWLCFNLARRRPVFMLADDAHWADTPSLSFAAFLAPRLREMPVILALALRRSEQTAPGTVLDAIRGDRAAHILHPAPLSQPACARLIDEAYGNAAAPEFAHACFIASGGNPFYLRSLVDALSADRVSPDAENAEQVARQIPSAVLRSLLLRLSRLPSAAATVARALAILGADGALSNVCVLTDLDREQVDQAVDALARAGVLASGLPLRFVHPIVESTVLADIPAGARDAMHLRAARMLESAGSAERSAAHLLASEPTGEEWGVEVLRTAAVDALARGAPEPAVRYLRRARSEPVPAPGTVALLRELGVAEYLAGDRAAIEDLRRGLALATDGREHASIAQPLAGALIFADRWDEATDVLAGAIEAVGEADAALSDTLEAQLLAAAALNLSTRPLHREHLARVLGRELGDSQCERMLLGQLALWRTSEGERASVVCDWADRALAGGRLLAELGSESVMFYAPANTLMIAGAVERAHACYDAALEDARSRGSLTGFVLASGFRAQSAQRMGRLSEAEADCRAAIEADGDRSMLTQQMMHDLVLTLIDRGHLREAESAVQGFAAHFGRAMSGMTLPMMYARGHLALANGQSRAAADEFLRVGDWYEEWGERNPGLYDWRSGAALALAQLGEPDQAVALATAAVALSRAVEEPRALGIALRAAGLIADSDDRIDLLREAVTTLEASPARLEHARALIDLGAALRRRNHRHDAREPLVQGTDLADRCGATVLAARGHQELLAAGARPRKRLRTGAEALTPSESRVALLAADGLTTPQVAQQLFVTVNTVETHLRHAYLKLGIHSRDELASALTSTANSSPELPDAHAMRKQSPRPTTR